MAVTAARPGLSRSAPAPALAATFRQLSDVYLLAEGGCAPVRAFLDDEQTRSVCRSMRLTSGEPWSLPLLFPIDAEAKAGLGRADRVVVMDGDEPAATLHIESVFRIDKQLIAETVFRTTDTAHPGVAWLHSAGEYSIAGPVERVAGWTLALPGGLSISPGETAALIAAKGWSKVVGFQTRNPIHRAHEFCTKIALETADGLVIHPLLGETKPDDIPVEARLACYEVLVRNYYAQEHVLLAGFPAWMRYAGPREAVFHAQVRRNYGFTHFIVGRDHAGIGDYYGPFDGQRIFSEFEPWELGIEPVFFDFVHYCRTCGCMGSSKTCPHPPEQHVHLAGRTVRAMLRRGEDLPVEFTRPEVAEILRAAMRGAA